VRTQRIRYGDSQLPKNGARQLTLGIRPPSEKPTFQDLATVSPRLELAALALLLLATDGRRHDLSGLEAAAGVRFFGDSRRRAGATGIEAPDEM
jgi:hypothetical protein